MQKRAIHLEPAEREKLAKLVRNGKIQADVVKHAYMLLHSDAGKTDVAIAEFLLCSEDTVRRTRVRYLTEVRGVNMSGVKVIFEMEKESASEGEHPPAENSRNQ